ncbi:MAG: HAMP domain-containing protein [Bacteroidetes bacterium]|nr:HAMP domain-containing protein [Bacteroidota bacterium]MBU2506841.1 HAMP domain-containing protein [Bacteroidota bacterium]
MIAIIAIVTVFGSINAYLIWTDVQHALEKESEKRALHFARNLSAQLVNPILTEDYFSAQRILDHFLETDTSLIYAFILRENEVLLHTFQDGFPKSLSKIPFDSTNELSVTLVKNASNPNAIIRDLGIPILNRSLGILRIGISEESIFYDVQKTVFRFWQMVALFLFLGLLGAFFFAYFITKPISAIQAAADALDLRSLKYASNYSITIRTKTLNLFKPPFRAKDEIDMLTDKFNDMITRLNKTYLELEAAQKNLIDSEKLATLGTIASGIAHEINNPISGLLNAIRRIMDKPEQVEQNKKYFRMMKDAATRIEKVVKELLSLSRKQELVIHEFDIVESINNVHLLLNHKINSSKISFETGVGEEARIFYASRQHIEQVIINLVLNSIDVLNESQKSTRRIIIKTHLDGNYTLLTVEDNGSGIEKENLDKIFEPFYTNKPTGKGTGLGLAVTSKIISSHNGKIDVESTYGQGTIFIIKLPAKPV